MKLTLANIKELKRKSDSPLTKRVCNYVRVRCNPPKIARKRAKNP